MRGSTYLHAKKRRPLRSIPNSTKVTVSGEGVDTRSRFVTRSPTWIRTWARTRTRTQTVSSLLHPPPPWCIPTPTPHSFSGDDGAWEQLGFRLENGGRENRKRKWSREVISIARGGVSNPWASWPCFLIISPAGVGKSRATRVLPARRACARHVNTRNCLPWLRALL